MVLGFVPSYNFLGCELEGWVPLCLLLHALYFQGLPGQVSTCDSLLLFPIFPPEASSELWESSLD